MMSFKRTLALVLALSMTASAGYAASAADAEGEGATLGASDVFVEGGKENDTPPENPDTTADDILAQQEEKKAEAEQEGLKKQEEQAETFFFDLKPDTLPSYRSGNTTYWRDRLSTALEKDIYDKLDVALKAPPSNSKVVLSGIFDPTNPNNVPSQANNALSAILADRPDTTYWVHKLRTPSVYSSDGTQTFYFNVIDQYRGAQRSDTIDSTHTYVYYDLNLSSQPDEMKEADKILAGAPSGTEAKIKYFVQEICRLTDYDHDAVTGKPNDYYTKSWQMTSVFDGDSNTKSVCEAYAKAFEYLCSKSGITCVLAEGTIGGGGNAPAGPHMWNLVFLDGEWWTVDVTNSDGTGFNLILVGTSNSDYQTVNFQFDSGYNTPSPIATGDRYVPGSGPVVTYYSVSVRGEDHARISLSPGGSNLAANTNVTVTVTPDAGYENPVLYLDGNRVALNSQNQYSFNIGSSNHALEASASRSNTYSVRIRQNNTVDITASPLTNLKRGDTVSVQVTPRPGYENASATLDGRPVTLDADGRFTFTVSGNHEISGSAVKETFVESVSVTPSSMTIGWSSDPAAITGLEKLTATVVNKSGKNYTGNVQWRSSNQSVVQVTPETRYDPNTRIATASVSPTGYNGTAVITATADGVSASCTVRVTGGEDKPVREPEDSSESSGSGSSKKSNGSENIFGWQGDPAYSTGSRRASSSASSAFKPVSESAVVGQTKDAVAKALKDGDTSAAVTVRNALSVACDTLRSMQSAAKNAGGTSAVLLADTMKGNAVESRIYLDASQLSADAAGDIKLRVYTSNDAVKNHFEKHFSNKVAVVRFEHSGSFGMECQVATLVDLKGFDTKNLVFYAYDIAKNSYVKIAQPRYFIDKAGYLHFYTSFGGNIIISDGALSK